MLTQAEREALQKRYFPSLEEAIFGPLHAVLGSPEFQGAKVLDAGSGKGTWILEQHKAVYGLLLGVDVYPAENRLANAFALASLDALPFRAGSLDLILCYVVLEHLAEPQGAFTEFARVLRPGGTLCVKTPAAYAPTSLLTRLLPFHAHPKLKGMIGIKADDVFPTYFRCNTAHALRGALRRAGFQDPTLLRLDQTYAYMSLNRASYTLGLLYSRALQHPWLNWLSNGIVAISKKGGVP